MTKKKNLHTKMLRDYPDVLNVYQMCEALGGISTKTGYKLIKEKKIESINPEAAQYIREQTGKK